MSPCRKVFQPKARLRLGRHLRSISHIVKVPSKDELVTAGKDRFVKFFSLDNEIPIWSSPRFEDVINEISVLNESAVLALSRKKYIP